MSTPTPDLNGQLDFLDRLSHAHLGCRQGHDLPVFAPTRNGRLPAGITAIGPFRDGSYDVLRRCNRCSLVLTHHTDTRGLILEGKPRRRYPQGYLAKGVGRISRSLSTNVGFQRVADALYANAIKPNEE